MVSLAGADALLGPETERGVKRNKEKRFVLPTGRVQFQVFHFH